MAKTIIRTYNRLSKVLIEYEILYHRTWVTQVVRGVDLEICIYMYLAFSS